MDEKQGRSELKVQENIDYKYGDTKRMEMGRQCKTRGMKM